MGMDVFSKNASNESGEYFRASIWSWPVIHRLMATECRDVLSDDLLEAMASNEGAGPDDQATCDLIAERLEVVLKAREEFLVAETCRKEPTSEKSDAKSIVAESQAIDPDAYAMLNTFLAEWITFLRNCGGFAVW